MNVYVLTQVDSHTEGEFLAILGVTTSKINAELWKNLKTSSSTEQDYIEFEMEVLKPENLFNYSSRQIVQYLKNYKKVNS